MTISAPRSSFQKRRGHALAGIVHEGHGLERDDPLAVDVALGYHAVELLARGSEAVATDDLVDRQEADIMPRPLIFRTRIAQTDDELHGIPRI